MVDFITYYIQLFKLTRHCRQRYSVSRDDDLLAVWSLVSVLSPGIRRMAVRPYREEDLVGLVAVYISNISDQLLSDEVDIMLRCIGLDPRTLSNSGLVFRDADYDLNSLQGSYGNRSNELAWIESGLLRENDIYQYVIEHNNDSDFVLAAVRQYGWALKYAHEEQREDLRIVLVAVQNNGLALHFADQFAKINREIVLAAVNQNGLALFFADETLRKDREIILAAVKQNGLALQFADDIREIILTAVDQNEEALKFADYEGIRKSPIGVRISADDVLLLGGRKTRKTQK